MNLEPIQKALDWYSDTIFQVRQKKAREGTPVVLSCSKGCSACCSEPLAATEPEMLLMLSKLSAEQLAEVKERTQVWLAKAQAMGLDDMDDAPNAFVYRAHNLECPFLKNKMCIAYHQRPLGCRAHMAIGPRQACEDLNLRPKQKFCYMPELLEAANMRLINAVIDGAGPLAEKIFLDMGHLGSLLARHFKLVEVEVKHG